MMRLIDADTLGIKEAEKEAYNEFVEHSKKYGNTSLQMYCYLEGKADGLIEASGRVKFAPTIDAVPVVRCWECKYCHIEDEYEAWCHGGLPAVLTRAKEDFCSHGKRREDGDNDG